MGKVRRNISLDEDVNEFAERYAEENRTNVSTLVNQWFFELMKREEAKMKTFELDRHDFAKELGFENYEALLGASENVHQEGDISWFVTTLPDGRFASWDEAELSMVRVEYHDTHADALAAHGEALGTIVTGEAVQGNQEDMFLVPGYVPGKPEGWYVIHAPSADTAHNWVEDGGGEWAGEEFPEHLKPTLGKRILEHAEQANLNGVSVNNLVCEFFNCEVAEVDEEGDIWIENPQQGHWLRGEEKEKLLSWLEKDD